MSCVACYAIPGIPPEQVNVEGSVGLLEEEVAVLQKHMELNASRADGLFLHSLGWYMHVYVKIVH